MLFRADAAEVKAGTDEQRARERALNVADGNHQAFRNRLVSLPFSPSEWPSNPRTAAAADASVPWWKVSHLDPSFGDIKLAWEPARFAWAYDLVRGYLLTGDDRYPAAFHHHFSNWRQSSPPFRGLHWSCGQETAIRAVALLYAEANFADAPSSDDRAMAAIAETLAASGERIYDAIGYAISQRNNHGISEAAGLIALGVRFRGLHPEAGRWLDRGRAEIERLILEQFEPDGWYIQHSFNYLRVALDQCVIAERALRTVGLGLSRPAMGRLRAATDLLLAVMDPQTGLVPNHGANDGALVHPITTRDFRDYRPVVTAVSALWKHPLPAEVEPDREVLAWLSAAPPPVATNRTDGVLSGPSGWASARVGQTSVFLRAGSYRSRPGHLDPLQLDIRFGGREVVVDPGTYSYNAPPPWRNGLATARVHNGPMVDGQEPGVRGPRFLWYIWPSARLLSTSFDGREAVLQAEIPGVVHRTVSVRDGEVEVVDRVLKAGASQATVCWTLHPDVSPDVLEAEGARVAKGEPQEVIGWFSPHYDERISTASVCVAWSPAHTPELRTRVRAPGGISPVDPALAGSATSSDSEEEADR